MGRRGCLQHSTLGVLGGRQETISSLRPHRTTNEAEPHAVPRAVEGQQPRTSAVGHTSPRPAGIRTFLGSQRGSSPSLCDAQLGTLQQCLPKVCWSIKEPLPQLADGFRPSSGSCRLRNPVQTLPHALEAPHGPSALPTSTDFFSAPRLAHYRPDSRVALLLHKKPPTSPRDSRVPVHLAPSIRDTLPMLTPTHLSDLSLNAMQSEMDLPQGVLIFHVLLSWRPSQPKCRSLSVCLLPILQVRLPTRLGVCGGGVLSTISFPYLST